MRKIVLKKCRACGGSGNIGISSYMPWTGKPFQTEIKCSCGSWVRVNGDSHEEVLNAAINSWNE